MGKGKSRLSGQEESLDDLVLGGMKLFQSREGYRFSLDAVLLAHFPALDGIKQVVDLGTGNGVIALLLAFRAPSLRVIAVEIQETMVKRARKNIAFNHLEDRIDIVQADIKTIKEYLPPQAAELVVSNPPFWKKGEGRWSQNPEKAVARHELEVELAQVVLAATYILLPGGRFSIIQRAERLQEIIMLFSANGLTPKRIRPVYPLPGREARMVLVEGQKGGAEGLTVMPPLLVYESPGVYSAELQELYSSSRLTFLIDPPCPEDTSTDENGST
ncbi:MAG: tRNA1(Val) (adenine(37)-N6)-methyltransferase [Syntrophomonas sp.]|uniref:tRNA1(Val) (adenine(37)-N6)-methyltransferase n=1 Tax=Syntrophomonas sp. TaxID=2053627 RepID=UPI002624C96C|nr:tRNA1(Val) (adenine(37)-N6)-methyltransferase [Syntrophomonas sp.]MDD2510544.1 tRNA1(Val) (adenine(37)-N6)-methyltransferase [Syntrophomonas sp.]MDD3879036.1 tRNA1(Val) (adenine(37)-N6)-methyltransferase [Syntrophomonas sp.]MDD4626365.1 tRNA1(Val) (adenine(37)-N6)-methyltransferase [Syntrophomonas sp.]